MVDEESLRRRARRSVLVRLRRRLGGRAFLHRLCAAAAWRDVDRVRGQAGRHARCRRLLARDRGAGAVALFTAPTAFRAIKKEDPDGQLLRQIRPVDSSARCSSPASAPIPNGGMGREDAERAGGRSLVADRDRLVHRRQSGRPRHAAGEARLADRADARLRRAHRR